MSSNNLQKLSVEAVHNLVTIYYGKELPLSSYSNIGEYESTVLGKEIFELLKDNSNKIIPLDSLSTYEKYLNEDGKLKLAELDSRLLSFSLLSGDALMLEVSFWEVNKYYRPEYPDGFDGFMYNSSYLRKFNFLFSIGVVLNNISDTLNDLIYLKMRIMAVNEYEEEQDRKYMDALDKKVNKYIGIITGDGVLK